jgi:hypothetical protein
MNLQIVKHAVLRVANKVAAFSPFPLIESHLRLARRIIKRAVSRPRRNWDEKGVGTQYFNPNGDSGSSSSFRRSFSFILLRNSEHACSDLSASPWRSLVTSYGLEAVRPRRYALAALMA